MKTVFITCFTGLIGRNILASDAFDRLKARSDLRLVIIAPESRAQILRREFGGERVAIEAVSTPPPAGRDRVWWVLATHLLPSGSREVQRRVKLARDRNYLDYVISRLIGFFGAFRFVRRLFRRLAASFIATSEFEALFLHYRPDLVFATDVYTPYDVKLMRLAEKLGIPAVGMVRSWDNVTSKTFLVMQPEHMVAPTNLIRDELIRYGDVSPNRVLVSGIPHYERYLAEPRTPREVFFTKLGLDPRQKLILFTPPSEGYLRHDPVAPVVLRALEPLGVQVLVRFSLVGKVDLGDYRPPKHVVFDRPENSPDFLEVHMNRAADQHLADSLYHADLVITWASTVIVDAVLFGKPVILVGFDAALRPYGESIQQYYDYDHQRRIIEMKGVRFARSAEELVGHVRAYLADPTLDLAMRQETRAEYCGKLDGHSGERLAQFLLARLR